MSRDAGATLSRPRQRPNVRFDSSVTGSAIAALEYIQGQRARHSRCANGSRPYLQACYSFPTGRTDRGTSLDDCDLDALAIFEAMSQPEGRDQRLGSWSTNSMRWVPSTASRTRWPG